MFLKDLEDNAKEIYACDAINFTNRLQHVPINYVTNLHEMGQRDRDVKVFNIKNQICHFLPMKIENFFPHLQEIEVDSSGLKQLSRENFASLPKLTMAIFPGNDIEFLPGDLFSQNPRLTHIDFSQNKLKIIDKSFFNNLYHLKYLMFDENECFEGTMFDEIDAIKDEILKNCSRSAKQERNEKRIVMKQLEEIKPTPTAKAKELPKKDERKPEAKPPTVPPTVNAIETTQVTNESSVCKVSSLIVVICTLSCLYEMKIKF